MVYSKKCRDKSTYWDKLIRICLPCRKRPGYEITPNCGLDDDGGSHEPPSRPCKANKFNDGSRLYCQPCSSCLPGFTVSNCNSTTDTKCQEQRSDTTTVHVSVEPTTYEQVSAFYSRASTTSNGFPWPITVPAALHPDSATPAVLWAVPLVLLISILLFLLSACVMYMMRKRGQPTVVGYNRRSVYLNAGFSPLSVPPGYNDLEDTLSPNILSAPLQMVLDNLDVLEELVILLDPETHGVKNTKHLASQCSFPSTWITYTYSMKESKSPLKAVLEGVTSRHPDWTVGHLAKLLRHMERNDAVAILAKLRQNAIPV